MSARTAEKLPDSGKMNAHVIAWSYEMAGHAQKFVERFCELANKNIEQLEKVSAPCMDDRQWRIVKHCQWKHLRTSISTFFKKEKQETVEELSKVWFEIDLKCLCLESIGRPDIPWSVKKLAREVTKWTRACDRRSGPFDFVHS